MKLLMQRELLLKPLQLLTGVVEKKQTLPILANVLIKVLDDKLVIIGADLEIELRISLPINGIGNTTSFTVSANKLMDICRALPEDATLELTQSEKNVFIHSLQSSFTLATLPVKDFPLMDQNKCVTQFRLSRKKLLHLLKSTSFAMAQQDVRYYLNGMLWEVNVNELKVVSTDGHRMAVASTTMDESIAQEGNDNGQEKIIVPRKAIIELMRLLDDTEEEVTVEMGPQHIRLLDSKYNFTSKLIDGRFPDYRRVIPQASDKKIIFDKDALKSALARISILSNEQLRAVCFQFRQNQLCLYANNVVQETAEEKMQITYEKEDFDIVFNINYLLDVLTVCKTDEVCFNVKDSTSSVLIDEMGRVETAFFVVMPMCL
jgi:DNA polymerase-3 subunit beta